MNLIAKGVAKMGNAAACKNIHLSAEDFDKHLFERDFKACLKDVQDMHKSGALIMSNVLALEGVNGDEETAFTIISSLPRYEREFIALSRAVDIFEKVKEANDVMGAFPYA